MKKLHTLSQDLIHEITAWEGEGGAIDDLAEKRAAAAELIAQRDLAQQIAAAEDDGFGVAHHGQAA
jgi:hypothetical protein